MMTRLLAVFAAAFTVTACGGSEPPAKAPTHETTDDDGDGSSSPIAVSAEVGALDEEKVTRVFQDSVSGLQACLNAGAKRVEFIGGSVAFSLEVDQSGHLASGYVAESTLGDRATEKCMLGVLEGKSWPAPVGGQKGLAKKSFDFDPPNDVRAPEQWSEDRVREALDDKASDISACKSSAQGSYQVTLYVGTSGQALSVGVAPPSARGESAADCLVELLKGVTYPSPGSWPAKVSLSL